MTNQPADLSQGGLLDEVDLLRRRQLETGVQLLRLVAEFARQHGQATVDPEQARLPGRERAIRLGGDGTPLVAEFAPAMLAARLGLSVAMYEYRCGPRPSLGYMAHIHPEAWVAPSAVVTGDVTIGPRSRVLAGAVITGDLGPVVIGSDVLVMEQALLRGRADHPLEVGDSVLIGPHTHLNGTTIEDEVFVATGVSMFPGSRAGAGSELRINSVLHVNSELPPGTVVPIGWIAAGRPAELFSPDRHEELWQAQEPLDFPGTVYGVPRGTSMREIMRRQCEAFGAAFADPPPPGEQ